MSERCPACGGSFAPSADGATHAYMLSSPGCWAAYGEVLAREYSNAVLFGAAHRLTVDAYAVQHPGDPNERRAVQSFWIHGASLWMVLRLGADHQQATAALKRLAGGRFASRPDPVPDFASTHAELLAISIDDHVEAARRWAEHALQGWSAVHDEFKRLAESVS